MEFRFGEKLAEFLKTHTTRKHALREKAIVDYHDLLVADEALSSAVFEKLRNAMRNGRLLYGERPIGVSLRPHFLDERGFHTLTQTAQRIASALEKVATALVQSPGLMHQLGLTDAECNLALVDPGSSTAAITTRLDAFVRDDEIKFEEHNAENPSSLSDQEELNLLLFELPAMATFARRYRLRQFSPVERLLETLLSTLSRVGLHGGAEHRDSRLAEFAHIERIRSPTELFHRAWCSHHHLFTSCFLLPERRHPDAAPSASI